MSCRLDPHISVSGASTNSAIRSRGTIVGDLEFVRRSTDIYNAALATPQDIDDADIAGQVVTDSGSITSYGTNTWSAENLITDGGVASGTTALEETKLFAQSIVDDYADPRTRLTQLQFKGLPPARPARRRRGS